jgi:hypothetical protein
MSAAALIVAHPGHEVRAYGWYERAQPHLFVLTDGGGSGADDRLDFSRRLAAGVGAPISSLFGSFGDRDLYAAVLARDPAPFLAWTGALAEALAAIDPSVVVVDSWQMYNVSHDLVHVMGRVAAEHAGRRLGHPIRIAEYDPAPARLGAPVPRAARAFAVELDEPAFARKQAAASRCTSLRAELNAILESEGLDAQRIELYRDTPDLGLLTQPTGFVPPYEHFGAERVAAGRYTNCIRWGEHVAPVVAAIRTARL